MKDFENVINELMTELLLNGHAEFSQGGLKIKACQNSDGGLDLSACFESDKDDTEALVTEFEDYVQSLNDDFFLEVAESFPDGALKKIQDKLDSGKLEVVKEGIKEFTTQLKRVATSKILEVNDEIKNVQKELDNLFEVRESYEHVLKKTVIGD